MKPEPTIEEIMNDIKDNHEMIKSIGSIFLLETNDDEELCNTLAKMEDLPQNCLFSDDLLDEMRECPIYWVRRICAMAGRPKDLDVLVSDENDLVRFEVLFHKRPQDLQILKDDANLDIREAAIGWVNSDNGSNGVLGRY